MLRKWREENQFESELSGTTLDLGGRLWVEQYQLGDLRPPIPEDFWENGVLREIKEDAESTIKQGFDVKTPIDDLRKKLSSYKSALRGDDDPDELGLDVDAPEQLSRWYRQALDIIANALS